MSDTKTTPRIHFADYLPEIFRAQKVRGVDNSFFLTFLSAFEAVYEEFQGEIEGTADRTAGGMPDLFDPALTPPSQFKYGGDGASGGMGTGFDLACLTYLANWIGLPLRQEKDCAWNRQFFQAAIPLYATRGTRTGLEGMLRIWLSGELQEATVGSSGTLVPLVFDLTRSELASDTLFQFDDSGRPPLLGLDTCLGDGPLGYFGVDLVMQPSANMTANHDRPHVREQQIMVFIQAARTLLEIERPAGTYYQLCVRAQSISNGPYRTWVYESEGTLKEITNG